MVIIRIEKKNPLQTWIKYLVLGRYRATLPKSAIFRPISTLLLKPTRLSLLKYQCVFGYVVPARVCIRGHLPIRVTAGHHANRMRRNSHAESVIFYHGHSWRYSRNYGFWLLRQWRNVPRGLHYWRRQNYSKYEISMTYGNIQANDVMRVESPRR